MGWNHPYGFLQYLISEWMHTKTKDSLFVCLVTSYKSSHVHCPFQFGVSIRKAAQQLVRLPPKTLPKPQLQPPHPFSVVKLRHVDLAHAETKPQLEGAEPPVSPSSCQSAVHFMTRVLHRLKEVDEHISEVNSASCFISLTPVFCLFFHSVLFLNHCDCCVSQQGVNVDYISFSDYTFRLV